LRIVGIPTNP